jgi:FAD/FMN-containing dehydrogenase
MRALLQQLENSIEGDVQYDTDSLKKYSTDWSLFTVLPQVIVFPKHAEDIKKLVAFVADNKKEYPDLSLTARAAGTDMSGGPLNTGIIMDVTRYMQGTSSVERKLFPDQQSFYGHSYAVTGQATVLPGTFYRDFEPETLKENLILPCYPASRELCAIGGMVANNGAGEKTLKYGQNKDFVHRLKTIFSDGNEYEVYPLSFDQLQQKITQGDFEGNIYKEVYELVKNNWKLIQEKKPKTSKNAAGYYLWYVIDGVDSIEDFEKGIGYFDLTKLIVGAQGTTGMITEVTYKLVDVQPAHDLLVVYIRDLDIVPQLVEKLMSVNIEMLEMYDDNTFKIGIKFFKDFLKDKGFFGAIAYAVRFFPEVWLALTQGIPKLMVLAEFTGGTENNVHEQMENAISAIKDLPVSYRRIPRDKDEEKFWDFRHDSFKLLTEHSKETRAAGEGTRTAPFIDDIAVLPEHLPEYLPQLMDILKEYRLLYTIAGHLGDGNFHVIPLMRLDEIGDGERILEVSEKVYALALQYDASITAEHNDGIIRTPFLEQQFGSEMIGLFQKVKDIFDSQNIFNPGKKVGGTKQDIKKGIIGVS